MTREEDIRLQYQQIRDQRRRLVDEQQNIRPSSYRQLYGGREVPVFSSRNRRRLNEIGQELAKLDTAERALDILG